MATEIVKLFELEISTDKAVQDIIKMKEESAKLERELAKLELAQNRDEAAIIKKTLELKNQNSEITKLTNETANLIKVENEEVLTLESLNNANKALRLERSKLNLETEEGRQRVLEINATIDVNTAIIKENSDMQKKQTLNVGNYTDSIIEAVKQLENQKKQILLNIEALTKAKTATGLTADEQAKLEIELQNANLQLKENTKNLEKYGVVTEKTAEAANGLGDAFPQIGEGVSIANKAFDVLAKNPLLFALTAIVSILGALFTAFTKTQKGADTMGKVTAVLSGIMDALTGILSIVAEKLIGVFENPKQALKDFSTLIKENIFNRFEGLLQLLPQLGKALQLVFSGDFAEAAKTATNATLQVVTGVKNIVDKTSDAFNETAEKVKTSAEMALKYKNAQIALENQIASTTKALALQNAETEKQMQIAGDQTISLKEQKEANELARISAEKAAQMEINLANQQLNLIKLNRQQKAANNLDSRELAQQEADAYANKIAAESRLTQITLQNATERRQIAQDLFEQNLDYLINTFDRVKTENEKIIANDKTTFEEKKRILEETRALGTKSFEEQIAEVQKLTDVQINAADLLAETDAMELIRKTELLDLSVIANTRLMEILKERNLAISDLATAEVQINADKNTEILKQEAAMANFKTQEAAREYELAKNDIFARTQLELAALKTKEEAEIAAAKKIGASTLLIEKTYSKYKKDLMRAEQEAKLSIASGFAGQIANLAGENSKIGRIAAATQATIDTYRGAQSAFAQTPGGIGIKSIAAGLAVATGVLNVKKILTTKSGLPNDSGGGNVPVPTATAPTATAPTNEIVSNTIDPTINQGIVSRESPIFGNQNAQVITTLVVDKVTDAQQSANNNFKTSVL